MAEAVLKKGDYLLATACEPAQLRALIDYIALGTGTMSLIQDKLESVKTSLDGWQQVTVTTDYTDSHAEAIALVANERASHEMVLMPTQVQDFSQERGK
ncbi:hypothetical protein [Atlanticothrix silvestris]|uniref:hypothetical protein n=1 Tax=Atlanticothrix silvestris TaxID=2840444 RepID=UPI001CED75EE|nr:hypothetical protein [Atlanticothrix silvestris]